MPAPYSNDLRDKVLIAVDGGMSKTEAGRIFSIHRKTIEQWAKQREATDSSRFKVGYQQDSNHAITDWEGFRQFVQAHGDKTQAEMAQLWERPLSQRTISRALQKIGFTRKKRPTAIEKETNSSARIFLSS